MSPKRKQKPVKKTAWDRFSERFAKRLEKHQAEFQEMQRKYEEELDPERKQKLKIKYLEKISPTFAVALFEELASTSKRNFDTMMSEIGEAMNEKLEELARDVIDFEFMMRDPITVFQETFLTERVGRAVQKELEKHEELFEDPQLLLRLIALMAIREISFGVAFVTLRPFFEVLNMARDRLGIDENWAIASFALNLEESLVKKKLSELGVPKNEVRGTFHDLLEKTTNLIETKEGRRLASDVFLSAGYRKIRNKLVHEGHLWKPTRKETNEIVRHLLRLTKALWEDGGN
jgi:hypothetical protein